LKPEVSLLLLLCRENKMSIRQIVETVNMAVSALINSRYMDFKIFLLHYSAVNSKEMDCEKSGQSLGSSIK
jgi:hypothetical protein